MRVNKEVRKDATLLMLHHQTIEYLSGEVKQWAVTAYTVAFWHSIPQSNAWKILYELHQSHLITRHQKPGVHNVIKYSLNERGHDYVGENLEACLNAKNAVIDWKLAKYKRGLLK